jgi:hypothetical protein
LKAAVLTYHSHNISGTSYAHNDHVALAEDLESLHSAGVSFVTLDEIVEAVADGAIEEKGPVVVGISFDDGPVFDYYDFDHTRFGPQRSFRNILDDFATRRGLAQVPATSFVIASPDARSAMERAPDCGYPEIDGWLRDDWWGVAAQSGRHAIGNHSWDHVHHAPASVALSSDVRDDFRLVRSYADADAQIRQAGQYINTKVHGLCTLFGYPFGHVNQYLVEDYFPRRGNEHGMHGAFSVGGATVPVACSRWNIPRMVCGAHWRSSAQLLRLLGLLG